jgi:uncharacterized protein DUF1236
MERRLLLSTVAVALGLGTVAASAQTQHPAEHIQNAPQATQSQTQPRANPQSGTGAQNAPVPQAQQTTPAQPNMPNAQPPAPSATTGQAAPQTPPSRSNAANQAQQPAAGQAQTQPQQGMPAQGQAPSQAPSQAQGQGPAQSGMTQGNTAGAAGGTNAPQNANTNANAGTQGNPQGVITLNEQQNTRVGQAIRQANVRPLTNVRFSIAVGTTVPADVQLNVLPPELVEIVPQYRGFSFVVVEQEALIIDPGSRAIVAVVPFEAQQTTGANQAAPPPPAPAQAAAPPPRGRKKLDLTRDQREIQRRHAERHRKADKNKHVIIEERRTTTGAGPREPRVGDRVPDSAVIEGRPVEVYRDEPPVRDDRHHPSVRDIPLIGPLFGPRDED